MSRNQLLITAITTQGLSYREAARIYGVSKSLIHKLPQQQRVDPNSSVEPRSRRPHTCPNSTAGTTRACGNTSTGAICRIHHYHATVITHTGEVLGEYTINPEKDYHPKDT